jgi:4-hydroxybenzoate polyprenyltransferase
VKSPIDLALRNPIYIIRPINLTLVAATMFVVLFKYKDESVANYWFQAIFLILPAVLTAAAGYVVNDIFDIETDKINKPNSCIVGHSLSIKSAWVLYGVISISSIVVSYFFSQQYAIINICIMALLFLYAAQLKGMPLIGNIIVALCSAAVVSICILLIAFDTKPAIMNFTGYIIFSFFVSLIRELVKDMQDVDGDLAAGLKTYPIVAGIKGTKIMIYMITGIEILLCGLYSFLSWGLDLYAGSILMGIITLGLLYFINHISKTKSKEEYGASSKLLKYIMFAGVINLIFA